MEKKDLHKSPVKFYSTSDFNFKIQNTIREMAFHIKHNGIFYGNSHSLKKPKGKFNTYSNNLNNNRDKKNKIIKEKINDLLLHIKSSHNKTKERKRNQEKNRNSSRYDIKNLLKISPNQLLHKNKSMKSMTYDCNVLMPDKYKEEVTQSIISKIRGLSVDIDHIGSSMNNNKSACHSLFNCLYNKNKISNNTINHNQHKYKPLISRNIVRLKLQCTNASKLSSPCQSHRNSYNSNNLNNFRKTKSIYSLF